MEGPDSPTRSILLYQSRGKAEHAVLVTRAADDPLVCDVDIGLDQEVSFAARISAAARIAKENGSLFPSTSRPMTIFPNSGL